MPHSGANPADFGPWQGSPARIVVSHAPVGTRRDAATARVLHNLAETRRRQGRAIEALALLDRVAMIEAEVLPADHLQTATTHHTRGNTLIDLGRLDEAERELAWARRLLERSGTENLQALETSEARLARLRAQ